MIEKKGIGGFLNLLLLHDDNEDFSPKRWIRASSPLDDFKLRSTIQILMEDIMKVSRAGRTHVYKKIAEKIRARTSKEPSFSSIHAWVKGTYAAPLIFLECLFEFHAEILGHMSEEKVKRLLPLLARMSSGHMSSRVLVRIPNTLTADLAYFLGVVTGDGSLPNVRDKKGDRIYEIKVEGACQEFFEETYCPLALRLFGVRPRLSKRTRQDGRVSWQVVFGAKPIFRLLARLFEIPVGKKHDIVRMPTLIKSSTPEIRACYIKGLFDTDGSISRGCVAFYSGSQSLMVDVASCLGKLGIDSYLHEYDKRGAPEFQLYVGRSSTEKFVNLIGSSHPLKNEKLAELIG